MGIEFQVATEDPEEFQQHMSPLVGPNWVRPARGACFHISVKAKKLNTLGMFTVRSPSLIVDQTPPLYDFALNIPLGSGFSVTDSGRTSEFINDAYLRLPDRSFHFEATAGCRVLVAGLDSERFTDYAFRLNGLRQPSHPTLVEQIPLSTTDSHALVRGLARLWSSIQANDPALGSAIALAEKEDEVITQFVLAVQVGNEAENTAGKQVGTAAIDLAEDYLCANLIQPVSRADLAAVCGMSIRTLSRSFTKRWGTGPMGFLKMQRMNATYRELLGASPDETTVTEIALKYGFSHLGRFARDFKRAFHESPSVTLQQ